MKTTTHHSKHHLTPYPSPLTETLQNLIAPGRRVRLSPFIESAQFQVLFSQQPDPRQRHHDAQKILKAHTQDIRKLAQTWLEFLKGGRSFQPGIYQQDFLRAYLAYYLTVNVCKIQLVLLELVRQERLSDSLIVEDIGVGAGTTAVAVLDFLLAYANVCDLYDAEFPIQSLQLTGSDTNPDCLRFAQKTVQAYAYALTERISLRSEESPISDIPKKIKEWAGQAQWRECDLNHYSPQTSADAPTLLFASNVLNELDQQGKRNLADTISHLAAGSIAIIIEPGEKKHTTNLNQWRKELLLRNHALTPIAPCGEEYPPHSLQCGTCWNARRESLHQPLLYKHFRKAADAESPDPRTFNEFENRLLSWSYVCLLHSSQKHTSYPLTRKESQYSKRIRRYIGSYQSNLPVVYDPDDVEEKKPYAEFIKLCPGHPDVRELFIKQTPGIQIPSLIHGEQICIENIIARWDSKERSIGEYLPTKETQVTPIRRRFQNREMFLPAYCRRIQQAVDDIAYRLFGFQAMHPFQHRILASVLAGRSILGIAATGGGKSECFILPAMLLPGITIVVSPLKSLMQDQYEQRICRRYGLNHLASFINGDISFRQRQVRLRRLELGDYKLIYFTPEQLEQGHVLDTLKRANENIGIRYLALDEAHCISQWGHDFRSSYLNLVRRLRGHGIYPVRIALTATASPDVRQDLCEELELDPASLEEGGDIYIYSSNRPELNLMVRVLQDTGEKSDAILDDLRYLLKRNEESVNPGAAIVFMPLTGGNPEHTYFYLPHQSGENSLRGRMSSGVTPFASYIERILEKRISIYHSRMDYDNNAAAEKNNRDNSLPLGDLRRRKRRSEQDDFISGKREIMAATKGFGMGIDKDNVRLVIHRTPPANLEAYVQEAGRAGRDGEQADTILYYSPDRPGKIDGQPIRSDRDIQESFLNKKYIRGQDVLIMRDFLHLIKKQRRIRPYLYFTNDEAIDFFNHIKQDHTPYQWPEVRPRTHGGWESGEHEAILDLGYVYEEKTRYIGRILSVLHRIRPKFPGRKKPLAFIEKVQETGACLIRPEVKDAEAILDSNYYFGHLLRNRKLTPEGFQAWIQRCANTDLFDFARYLKLSPGETVSLLRDIRNADRSLLDFRFIAAPRYGPAAGKNTLSAWRNYAGARKRANKKEADERRKKRHADKLTIDHWFSWKEMTLSKGWEVLPGPAFELDEEFDQYLKSFIEAHDQRMRNDWDAYRRLLSDYIGADEQGYLRPEGERNCLRSVMLGYLETYEVITGDNCLSCSRCVPHGEFERDMEKRRNVVVSLGAFIKEMLDTLKNRYAKSLPSSEIIGKFWHIAETEQNAGRSLFSYLEGWTGRLLADIPGHRASLWLRITGMARGFMYMRPSEFTDNFRQLIENCSHADSEQIMPTLRTAHLLLPNHPEICLIQAALSRRLELYEEEKEIWQRLRKYPAGWMSDSVLPILRQTQLPLAEKFPELAAWWLTEAATSPDHYQDDQENLGVLASGLMKNPQFKHVAHETWLKLCTIWPGEIAPHLQRCLASVPPEIRMAEDCLELLLQEENDAKLCQAAKSWPSGRSFRIDRVLELSNLLDRLTMNSDITSARKLRKSHFSAIFTSFDPEKNMDHADMAASLIAHLRQHVRSADWQTAYHVRAFRHARRFEEMNQILSEHPELARDNPAGFFARQFSRLGAKISPDASEKESFGVSHSGNARNAPITESDYQRLIRNRVGRWAFFIRMNRGGIRDFFQRFVR